MAKTQTGSAWDQFKNAKVSLVTGTLALATAVIGAYSVMPSYDGTSMASDQTLLQASVMNIMQSI